MKRVQWIAIVAAVLLLPATAAASDELTAEKAFERLKALAGTWEGSATGEGEEAAAEADATGKVVHEFEVTASGHVLMERMGPDTAYEMVNMYHLDGSDLVLTHYCSSGNQPRMKFNAAASVPNRLVFDFDGGTNLDTTPSHIHSAEIRLDGRDRLDSAWKAHEGNSEAGTMTFHLKRQ
ncbi:MAG: hypothetical protein OXG83_05810 [Acidobacteria bacterium]|nr:hypothetical protein [Acidobacteriota bacterium]